MSTPPPGAATQDEIDREIAAVHAAAAAAPTEADRQGQPRLDFLPYRSTALRHPSRPLVYAGPTPTELSGPVWGRADVSELDCDLTINHAGEPMGQRIIVTGRLLDRAGRPVRGQLIEIWQANAAGRYAHRREIHPAPLDPNFTGVGRALTDDDGCYRFVTIRPGSYPWGNHINAWRPSHIHFSVFGTAFTQRLVTQMYFPGDPLIPYDPIFQSITDARARERLIAAYDHSLTVPEMAHGYRFDIVLDGPDATWRENG
ncbi:MAG: protocatechuate 3,4-dioxygenase subunit beta [Frankia sp.]|nr:protocatechuate 3,4-dioxygenase subunit beta [Frankia sp.]